MGRDREPEWPEPADDPAEEHGEDPETHLLPSLDRLRAMTPEQRRYILAAVSDWIGERVEQFRARVRELDR